MLRRLIILLALAAGLAIPSAASAATLQMDSCGYRETCENERIYAENWHSQVGWFLQTYVAGAQPPTLVHCWENQAWAFNNPPAYTLVLRCEIRWSPGQHVVQYNLKMRDGVYGTYPNVHPYECSMGVYFTGPGTSSDPRIWGGCNNHWPEVRWDWYTGA